jgi:hypothetical protein
MVKGSHHSATTKRRLSLRVRKFWTEEERAKASARSLRRLAKPEVRKRIVDGMRLALADRAARSL